LLLTPFLVASLIAGGRLLIPHLAREDETSVIYFDADTLVLGKEAVEQLLDTAQDLMYANDKLVAAADEHGCESSSSWYGSGEKASINSGVLVLNLRKLADSSLPDQWIKRANDYYGHWGDQVRSRSEAKRSEERGEGLAAVRSKATSRRLLVV